MNPSAQCSSMMHATQRLLLVSHFAAAGFVQSVSVEHETPGLQLQPASERASATTQ